MTWMKGVRYSQRRAHTVWFHLYKILDNSNSSAAAAAAKSTSVVSDSVRPHRWQPTRLPRLWDSPGKNTGVGCYFLLQCVRVKSESEVAQSCPTLSDPMDYSPVDSSIHGIFQARVLEWGAISFSIKLIYRGINQLYPRGKEWEEGQEGGRDTMRKLWRHDRCVTFSWM